MADFLERIEHHLRRVQKIEVADTVDADKRPDLARHDAMVVELFERIAAEGPRGAKWAKNKFSEWRRHRLEHFVDEVYWELLVGIGGRVTADVRGDYIDAAILIAVDHIEEVELSFPKRDRLREIAHSIQSTVRTWSTEYGWEIVSRYCERLALVSQGPVGRAHGLPDRPSCDCVVSIACAGFWRSRRWLPTVMMMLGAFVPRTISPSMGTLAFGRAKNPTMRAIRVGRRSYVGKPSVPSRGGTTSRSNRCMAIA